jgi:transposase
MKDKKAPKKRRSYDAAFKANILKLNADGRSIGSLSESFGINENLIYRWKRSAKGASVGDGGSGLQAECLELRKEVRQLKEERDILKKALSIFSRLPYSLYMRR